MNRMTSRRDQVAAEYGSEALGAGPGAAPVPSAGLWAAFSLIAFAIYLPALGGPFISDDLIYIVMNPWTESISIESVFGIFDPTGEARFQGANYAPLALLASAIERAVFSDNTLGYHAVNVLIHALNAVLLVRLLVAAGAGSTPSILGGLLFLVHPGNVEAVAWISQLKTSGALAFCLGSLLAMRRHPAWSALLFVMGLLTKASAVMALPMAAALVWSRCEGWKRNRTSWIWLAGWLAAFLLYGIPQYTAIHPRGSVVVAAYEDAWVHLYTIASIGVHYLVMASTTIGVAHAQEHLPARSFFDPWVLSAIPLAVILVWRIALTLRRRQPEAAFWLGAAFAFGPVSQLVPFSHPIANRYLYFLLPGLIGGGLFAFLDAARSLSRSGVAARRLPPVLARRIVGVAAVAVAIALGLSAAQRAHLWTDQSLLSADSARRFPSGRSALILEARQAARSGDAPRAVSRLNEAATLGRDHFQTLLFDSAFAPIAGDPTFRGFVYESAGRYIELVRSYGRPTQAELGAISVAHFERGELDEAESALERAVERGGIAGPRLAEDLESLRALRRDLERSRP